MYDPPNNPSHRHHYLPQFYLRQWTNTNGKLWRYRREPSGKVSEKQVAPKATGFQDALYSLRDTAPFLPERTPDVIEGQFFSPLDNLAANVLQRLVAGHGLPLPDDERTAWALFLNSLLERDPRTLQERDAAALALAEEKLESLRAKCQDAQSHARLDELIRSVDYAAMARNVVRQHMVNEIRNKGVVDYFKSLSWCVISVGPGDELITSNSPLVINGGHSKRPIYMFTLPLSPHKLFMMRPTTWNVEDDFLRLVLLEHNLSLVAGDGEFLYSSTRLEDGPVVRLRLAVEMRFGRPSFGDDSEPHE